MVAQQSENVNESTEGFVDKSTGEIVPTETANAVSLMGERPDDEALKQIENLNDVKEMFGETFSDASDLGSGFALLDDKDRLVGVPCVFLFWQEYPGDFEKTFVSAHVATFDGTGQVTGKFVINDGSTGIRDQLVNQIGVGRTNLLAKHGLRKSEFPYCETCGSAVPKNEDHKHKTIKASTYYIDTSA